MTVLLVMLFAAALLDTLRINFLEKDVKKLQKQVLELRSQLRKRQAGQSWQEIKKASQEEEIIQNYLGDRLWEDS